METWQIVILSYASAAILLCLLSLWRYHRLEVKCVQNNDYAPMHRFILGFFILFFLIICVMAAHIGYLAGIFCWPVIVVIGLMLVFVISLYLRS